MYRKSNRRSNAFTLIELLLVLVILGILAVVVVPKMAGRAEQAKKDATKPSIEGLRTALGMFEVDTGHFPTNEEGLNALVVQPSGAPNWHGPYIDAEKLNDAWNRPFVYRNPGSRNPNSFDIFSLGTDGQEGTADDIGNWSNTAR